VTVRRILLLYQGSLLVQGLTNLLREQAGLDVSAREFDDCDMEGFVQQLAPDVVIIDREDFASHAAITLDQLLRAGPSHMKVVDVSSRNDLARVYEGHQVRLAEFDDLLETFGTPRLGLGERGRRMRRPS